MDHAAARSASGCCGVGVAIVESVGGRDCERSLSALVDGVAACEREGVRTGAGDRSRRIGHGRRDNQACGWQVGADNGAGEGPVGVSDRVTGNQGTGTDAGRRASRDRGGVVGLRASQRDRDGLGRDNEVARVRDRVIRSAAQGSHRVGDGWGDRQARRDRIRAGDGAREDAEGIRNRIANSQGARGDAGRCAGGRCHAVVGLRARQRYRDRAGIDRHGEVRRGRGLEVIGVPTAINSEHQSPR